MIDRFSPGWHLMFPPCRFLCFKVMQLFVG